MKRLYRAEAGYIIIYNLTEKNEVKIRKNHLKLLDQWLATGEENDYIAMLIQDGYISLSMDAKEKEALRKLIQQCYVKKGILRSLCVPEIMNIELTTRCPLRCPQCYCDLNQGKDIKKEVALQYINQAAALKIPFINLSGGETLVYPHLIELIEHIHSKGLCSAIAISGWGFDFQKLQELKRAGIDEIYVSLNGSTEEVNKRSREGYQLAIEALKVLKADGETDYYINWVARNDNVEDFPQMVSLAKEYGVKQIVVLESKPDAEYTMQASLSKDNFYMLAEFLKKHNQEEISIGVEPCFSPLLAYLHNRFFVNYNTGIDKGCGAGRNSMAVDVNGALIPCRHLLHSEGYRFIEEYWQESEVLNLLRRFEDNKGEPCKNCGLQKNCLSCRAVADKVNGQLFSGNTYCPIQQD